MKKRGVTFIETVVAITIFLIGIIPIAQLTLNSLRQLKRASEIEEGARVATTVINYIKSQGYSNLVDDGVLLLQDGDSNDTITSKTYMLSKPIGETTYILSGDSDHDFEEDFFGSSFSGNIDEAVFLINSLGISSDSITIDVNLAISNLEIIDNTFSLDTSYTNPVSNTSGSGIIIGSGGIIEDPIIFGNVAVTYETLSDSTKELKHYDQNFVITPMENFITSY